MILSSYRGESMKDRYYRILCLILLLLLIFSPRVLAETSGARRVLIIGNSDYIITSKLRGVKADLPRLYNMFENNYFDQGPMDEIRVLEDAGKKEILYEINDFFSQARPGDTSYIYYGGHGYYSNFAQQSYLVGVDLTGLSVGELEENLSRLAGDFVLILDCCHSGGFIARGQEAGGLDFSQEARPEEFNQEVLRTFGLKARSNFRSSKYKVLTASGLEEQSYERNFSGDWGWGGIFTKQLLLAMGYESSFEADRNNDGYLSLEEVYDYCSERVARSNVQVYPRDDDFVLGADRRPEFLELIGSLRSSLAWGEDYMRPRIISEEGLSLYQEKMARAQTLLERKLDDRQLDQLRRDLEALYASLEDLDQGSQDYQVWEKEYEDVPRDSVWSIDFNDSLIVEDLENQVKVLDGNNRPKEDLIIRAHPDYKGFDIVAREDYLKDQYYKLIIGGGLRGRSGGMDRSMVLRFKTR